jgi:exopolysaccharide biosynthesis protein
LKQGGWLLKHSLNTQVTRRDRENERWPLIGCGITKAGNIVVVVIESRIRESVGATHAELAEILLREGAVTAMEYDSGGSASLYTEKGMVNIVPYTSTFNERPLTGRSEARPVANAILVRSHPKEKS